MTTPEQRARKNIDRLLKAAGWAGAGSPRSQPGSGAGRGGARVSTQHRPAKAAPPASFGSAELPSRFLTNSLTWVKYAPVRQLCFYKYDGRSFPDTAGPWPSGKAPPLHGGDRRFESDRVHLRSAQAPAEELPSIVIDCRCGRSSAVERLLAKEKVVSSSLIARSLATSRWHLAYGIEASVAYASLIKAPVRRWPCRSSSVGRARD